MLNPDKSVVEMVDQEIEKNKMKFGYRFCPCVPSELYSKENYKDYICPCRYFREEVEPGQICLCGKFIKE